MPYPVSAIKDCDAYTAYTDKDVSAVLGQRVWVIGREGKRYFLGSLFRATQVIAGQHGFAYGIAGQSGCIFSPVVEVGTEPWFPDLRRLTGNFGFGLTMVDQPNVVAGLSAAAGGCASVP